MMETKIYVYLSMTAKVFKQEHIKYPLTKINSNNNNNNNNIFCVQYNNMAPITSVVLLFIAFLLL